MLAGRETEREKGDGKEEYFSLRESEIGSRILKASLLYHGSLSCRSSRSGLPKKFLQMSLHEQSARYPDFLLLQRACFLYLCMRVLKWDPDPECKPN
jgi:hypothetical protein